MSSTLLQAMEGRETKVLKDHVLDIGGAIIAVRNEKQMPKACAGYKLRFVKHSSFSKVVDTSAQMIDTVVCEIIGKDVKTDPSNGRNPVNANGQPLGEDEEPVFEGDEKVLMVAKCGIGRAANQPNRDSYVCNLDGQSDAWRDKNGQRSEKETTAIRRFEDLITTAMALTADPNWDHAGPMKEVLDGLQVWDNAPSKGGNRQGTQAGDTQNAPTRQRRGVAVNVLDDEDQNTNPQASAQPEGQQEHGGNQEDSSQEPVGAGGGKNKSK